MPEDFAVVDEPLVETGDTGADIVDEPVDAVDTVETEPVTDPVDTPEEPLDEPEKGETEEDPQGDGRTMPQALRTAIAALKEDNPAAAKQVKDMFFAQQAFKAEFPRGLNEVREIKAEFDALGGQEGIQELRVAADELRDIDDLYAKGDPSFVEKFSTMNPEAFNKVVPLAVEKLRQADPEGYRHLVSQAITKEMEDSRIAMAFERFAMFIEVGKGPEAIAEYEKIRQFLGGFLANAAGGPPKGKTQDDPREKQYREREQQIQEKERQQFHSTLGSTMRSFSAPLIRKELEKYMDKGSINDDRLAQVAQSVGQRILELGKGDKHYQAQVARFEAARDVEGLSKLFKARIQQHAPTLVKEVHRRLFSDIAPPRKTAGAVAAKPQVKQQTDYKHIVRMPQQQEIDYSKSPRDLLMDRKATLKTGERVYWGPK